MSNHIDLFIFSICPIFAVSSVSGKNLDLLTKFLNVLPPLLSTKEREQFMQELAEHQVSSITSMCFLSKVVYVRRWSSRINMQIY